MGYETMGYESSGYGSTGECVPEHYCQSDAACFDGCCDPMYGYCV